ncbi:MAG: GC-type dockerin domain-anchored protein [Phycisphaerales bacterium JB052]
MNSTHSRTAGAIAAVSISTLIASAGAPTHSWLSPVDGNWNDSFSWDVGTVPGMLDHAQLGLSGAYTVSLPTTGNAMGLSITNPDAVFQVNNAHTMNLFGDLSNEGLIIINPTASGSGTQLDFEADAMLTGTGTILLNSVGSRSQIRTGAGVTFTQGLQHTIEGFGQITGSMVNNGTIDANVATLTLSLNSSDKANNSIMRASSGGNLQISSISVNQGSNGTIAADGPGSVVDFSNATLNNGNVQSTNDGLIRISNSTFDGVDFLQGEMHLLNAVTLDVFNSLTNDGVIVVNPNSSGSATQLDFESSGSFLGSGEVVLNSIDSRARLRTGVGVTMTNSATHTISGYGQIEADFINDGLVHANVLEQELRLNFNQKTNNAMMMATGGGILDFASIAVTQSPIGEIQADGAGSRIDFNGTSVTGGQINASGGASVEIINATYDGVSMTGPHNIANATTLDVFNSIVNNGVITINPNGFGSPTQLDFENTGSFLGNGEVVLNSLDSRARLRTGPGATMTNSASHTIRGYGRIEAALINDGLVRADNPGNEIFLNFDSKVNNSTMEAVDGAGLDFASVTVDQTGGGEIIASGVGSGIDLNSSVILGGDLMSINGGLIEAVNSTLDDVSFSGDMHVLNAVTLSISNSITNNGTITINPDSFGSLTGIDFVNDGAFNGNGQVVLNSFDARARIRTVNDSMATNTANHTIRGFGRIEAAMINNGTIRADLPSDTIFLNINDKANNATMTAVNGAELDFNSITVTQGPSGQISANGPDTLVDLETASIVGGQLETINGGRVQATSSTLDNVECNATIGVVNAASLNIRNGVTNEQAIIVNETGSGSLTQLVWLDDSQLGGNGSVLLNSFSSRARILISGDATMATMGENQRLEGIGSIDAPFTNRGTTAPGMSIGTMFASQPVTYTESSVFEAEVDGSTSDLLDSTSTIELDGTLNVVFIDGFVPAGFWARTIMEGSSITGKFDALNIPAPPSGLITRVINTGTEVRVGQTCPGDANLDGMVNFFDVSQFLADFAAESPDADLNNDNQWNFFDVSVFLSNFSLGC